MGKNPTEAKQNRDKAPMSRVRKTLHYFYTTKPNGAMSLRKEWIMAEMASVQAPIAAKK